MQAPTSTVDGRPQVVPPNAGDTLKVWYALRVTYARELKVQQALTRSCINTYIPMHTVDGTLFGRKCRRKVPAIHNLLFVNIEPERLREIKASTTLPIRYIMDSATDSPVIIPPEQMQAFMQVIQAESEFAEIVPVEEVAYRHGEEVEITGGPFCGVRGRYIRYKGHSKVAVELNGVVAALTAYIPTRYIKPYITD